MLRATSVAETDSVSYIPYVDALVQAIFRRSSPGDTDLNGGSVSGVKARSCGEDGVVKSSGSFSFVSGRQRLIKLCRRRLLLPGGGGFLSSSFAGFVSGVPRLL
ncbi:hypothetical protein YC2023_048064 [Brassica napus]